MTEEALLAEQIEIAKEIAEEAHRDRYRRDGSAYMSHVEVVVADVSMKAKPVAYLYGAMHTISHRDLKRKGIEKKFIHAAHLLNSRAFNDTKYIDRLQMVRENHLAKEVQIAKMKHNLSDNPTKPEAKRCRLGLEILGATADADL